MLTEPTREKLLEIRLGALGLRLKGFEIRGWTTSPLRWLRSWLPKTPRLPRLRVNLDPWSCSAGFV